jgi:thioredoxin-dependent peroxiredoxin
MVRRKMPAMMWMLARAGRVAGWMPVIVLSRCHALAGAPVRRVANILPLAGISSNAARSTDPWNRLRSPHATGNCTIDGSKTTKGRHMGRELVAGSKAPAFTLQGDGGTKVSLKDFKGRNLVLYFYPKADTPGCTTEAIAFSSLRSAFAKTGTEVLGVSADPVAAQDKFKAKHTLKIAFASDEAKTMLEAYGAWGEKSMYGRKFMGVNRKTFLIDGRGRIAHVWPKVSVPGHAEEVLEAAKGL